MSHRIIEKRRRDRMNNCLADLSRLVPTTYLKKGRGRIEKTEIIEMAIKHLKHLQAHPCKDPGNCEVAKTTEQDHKRQYRLGFQECMSETIRFLVEIEGLYAGDGLCVRLVNHLQKHYDKVVGGICYPTALSMMTNSEESKGTSMDIDHSSSYPTAESYSTTSVPPETSCETDSKPRESAIEQDSSRGLIECQEVRNLSLDVDKSEHTESTPGTNVTPVRITSQLREMLQNPGPPKERVCNSNSSSSNIVTITNGSVSHPAISASCLVPNNISFPKGDEVYKFKNNIKHRFNADLRHNTTSPTGSHSELIPLSEEDRMHLDLRYAQQQNSSSLAVSPVATPIVNGSLISHNHHSAFPPFGVAPMHTAELTVKIPERSISDSGPSSSGAWDSHGDCGSSCGSNPSPPSIARSNGSSSGYSTGGDIASAPKLRLQLHVRQSPATSPYPHTPENLSNCSPSPQPLIQTSGVPVFALHPKGTFYIPLTLDATYMAPYFSAIEDAPPVLHPVSISVNFSFCNSTKLEKMNGNIFQSHTHLYVPDRYNERYMYGERGAYSCSPVPHV